MIEEKSLWKGKNGQRHSPSKEFKEVEKNLSFLHYCSAIRLTVNGLDNLLFIRKRSNWNVEEE